jgi:hypothetical protein
VVPVNKTFPNFHNFFGDGLIKVANRQLLYIKKIWDASQQIKLINKNHK